MIEHPTLYVAARDIGNDGDVTDRVKHAIAEAGLVFVESFRNGSTFMKRYGVTGKTMREVSEHTSNEEIEAYGLELFSHEASLLLSDAGTPLVEDPGQRLVRYAYDAGVRVVPLPGVSSVTTALMITPFPVKRYLYYGLLPRNEGERIAALRALKPLPYAVVLLDAPYRITQVVSSIGTTFEGTREIAIFFDLTGNGEEIFTGTVTEAVSRYRKKPETKRPFVIVLAGSEGKRGRRSS